MSQEICLNTVRLVVLVFGLVLFSVSFFLTVVVVLVDLGIHVRTHFF